MGQLPRYVPISGMAQRAEFGGGARGTGRVTWPALRNWKVIGVVMPACRGWVVVSRILSSPTTSGLVGPAEPAVLMTVVPGAIWVAPSTCAWPVGLVTATSSSG